MTTNKKALTPQHKRDIDRKTRRKRVHNFLMSGKQQKEIAEIVGVSEQTIVEDVKAINKQLAQEFEDIKPADLSRLDIRITEALDEFDKWRKRADEMWANGDDEHGYPRGTWDTARLAVQWHQRVLEAVKLKGKWLGYEVVEKEPVVQMDNRSVVINISDPKSGEVVGFDKWAEGMFKELPDGADTTTP